MESRQVTPISSSGESEDDRSFDRPRSRSATESGESSRRVRAIGLGAWGIRGAELLSRNGVPARAIDTEPGVDEAEIAEGRRHRVEVEGAGYRDRYGRMARALAADPELGDALATDAASDLLVVVANLAVGAGALTPTLLCRLDEAVPGARRLVVARLPGTRSGPDERARGLVALNGVLQGPPTSVLLVRPPSNSFDVDPRVPLERLFDLWALTTDPDGDAQWRVSAAGLIDFVSTPGFLGWRAIDPANRSGGSDEPSWWDELAGAGLDWQFGGFDWSQAQKILPMVRMPRGWPEEEGRRQFERFLEKAWDEAEPCTMAPALHTGDPPVAMIVSAGMPYPGRVLALRDSVREDRERLDEKRKAAMTPIPLDEDFLFEGADALVDPGPSSESKPDRSAPPPAPEGEPTVRDRTVGESEPESAAEEDDGSVPTGIDEPPVEESVEEESLLDPEPRVAPETDPEGERPSVVESETEPEVRRDPETERIEEAETDAEAVPPVSGSEPTAPGAYSTALKLAKRVLHASVVPEEVDLAEIRSALDGLLAIVRDEPESLLPDVFRPEEREYFERHHVNVAVLAMLTAELLGKSHDEVIDLGIAGLLHDIGMVSTRETWETEHSFPPRVFFRAVKPHPEIGFRQLQEIPGMTDGIAKTVLGEHERMDGSGYPDGLKGHDIHPGARILAVCDTLEALTHPRPHHEPISPSQALARLQTLGKSTLDGQIVDVLTSGLEELLREAPDRIETRP